MNLDGFNNPNDPIIQPPPVFTGFSADDVKKTPILRHFSFAHLKEPLRSMSEMFARLAAHVVGSTPPSAEQSIALRKLLEGKDAAVRAAITEPAS